MGWPTISPMDIRTPAMCAAAVVVSVGISFFAFGQQRGDWSDIDRRERADATLLQRLTSNGERMAALAGSNFARIDDTLRDAGITAANWWCTAGLHGLCYRERSDCDAIDPRRGPCVAHPFAFCARDNKALVCFDSYGTCTGVVPACMGVE